MEQFPIIIGIGNSAPEYEDTYHNAGILAVQYLSLTGSGGTPATEWKAPSHKHFRYLLGQNGIIFAITDGFMNESGRGVKEALQWFGMQPEKMLLVHDDSDLPLGDYKISSGQGSAGHKGVASVIEALGTKEFSRARIGIRAGTLTGPDREKAEAFVLRKISREDFTALRHAFEKLGRELAQGGA